MDKNHKKHEILKIWKHHRDGVSKTWKANFRDESLCRRTKEYQCKNYQYLRINIKCFKICHTYLHHMYRQSVLSQANKDFLLWSMLQCRYSCHQINILARVTTRWQQRCCCHQSRQSCIWNWQELNNWFVFDCIVSSLSLSSSMSLKTWLTITSRWKQ